MMEYKIKKYKKTIFLGHKILIEYYEKEFTLNNKKYTYISLNKDIKKINSKIKLYDKLE